MSYAISVAPKRMSAASRRISAVQLYAQRNNLDYTDAASQLAEKGLNDILQLLGLGPKKEEAAV